MSLLVSSREWMSTSSVKYIFPSTVHGQVPSQWEDQSDTGSFHTLAV